MSPEWFSLLSESRTASEEELLWSDTVMQPMSKHPRSMARKRNQSLNIQEKLQKIFAEEDEGKIENCNWEFGAEMKIVIGFGGNVILFLVIWNEWVLFVSAIFLF